MTISSKVFDPADLSLLKKGQKHGLLIGTTGSGKTNLLLQLLDEYLNKGYRILHRDDTGLQFRYLMRRHSATLLVPQGCTIEFKDKDKLKPYDIVEFDYRNPRKIIREVLKGNTDNLTVIVFDAYCKSAELQAKFYRAIFDIIMTEVMGKSDAVKGKLIFSLDELNDIVQPRASARTKAHKEATAQLSYDIRKLRKFNVTILATTHRPNDIAASVRSHFGYYLFKKIEGRDVHDFLKYIKPNYSDMLYRRIQTLTEAEVLIIDYNNNFTVRSKIPLILDEKMPCHTVGMIKISEQTGEEFDLLDLKVFHYRTLEPPLSFNRIANLTGKSVSTIFNRYNRLNDIDYEISDRLQASRYVLAHARKPQKSLKPSVHSFDAL
ncbi:MAG: type IV secretion system DNA-binding domain-containing protein [archaeon]